MDLQLVEDNVGHKGIGGGYYPRRYAICICESTPSRALFTAPLDLECRNLLIFLNDQVYFRLMSGTPEKEIVRRIAEHVFLGCFGDNPVFPEAADVRSQAVCRELIQQGVSYAGIPKVYFPAFTDFLTRICAV